MNSGRNGQSTGRTISFPAIIGNHGVPTRGRKKYRATFWKTPPDIAWWRASYSPPHSEVVALPRHPVNHSRDVVSRIEKVCLMFKKTDWKARVRRFMSRNWKFLVQTGVTVLGILHK